MLDPCSDASQFLCVKHHMMCDGWRWGLSEGVCADPDFFLCSVWCRPVETARAGSCLDWAGASGPLASPEQRQVRSFSWRSSHSLLTSRQHTTVHPSLLSHNTFGFSLLSSGSKDSFAHFSVLQHSADWLLTIDPTLTIFILKWEMIKNIKLLDR